MVQTRAQRSAAAAGGAGSPLRALGTPEPRKAAKRRQSCGPLALEAKPAATGKRRRSVAACAAARPEAEAATAVRPITVAFKDAGPPPSESRSAAGQRRKSVAFEDDPVVARPEAEAEAATRTRPRTVESEAATSTRRKSVVFEGDPVVARPEAEAEAASTRRTRIVAFDPAGPPPSEAESRAAAGPRRKSIAFEADPAGLLPSEAESPAAERRASPVAFEDGPIARPEGERAADAARGKAQRRVSFSGPASTARFTETRVRLHLQARISPGIKAKAARGPLPPGHWLHRPAEAEAVERAPDAAKTKTDAAETEPPRAGRRRRSCAPN
ncbi:hypothetical protein M885DRAFT_529219 [Pelagophyceae sp. CCMP2097]|nr:hypothetical protein M885DRAFT_529219 [Pelagophyceae sp. CCMP2097]